MKGVSRNNNLVVGQGTDGLASNEVPQPNCRIVTSSDDLGIRALADNRRHCVRVAGEAEDLSLSSHVPNLEKREPY